MPVLHAALLAACPTLCASTPRALQKKRIRWTCGGNKCLRGAVAKVDQLTAEGGTSNGEALWRQREDNLMSHGGERVLKSHSATNESHIRACTD